jgi:hypothetical protein
MGTRMGKGEEKGKLMNGNERKEWGWSLTVSTKHWRRPSRSGKNRLDAPSNGKNWHRGYQDAPKEVQCSFNTGEESIYVSMDTRMRKGKEKGKLMKEGRVMREKNEDDHLPYRWSTGVGHHGLERTVLMRLPTARTGTKAGCTEGGPVLIQFNAGGWRREKGKERERERKEGFDENL